MKIEKSTFAIIVLVALVVGASIAAAFGFFFKSTSTNDSCMSCHYHEEGDMAWKQSKHYNNPSGTKTDCAACHLPPEGTFRYFTTKTRMGLKDIWSYITKKKEDIDWKSKSDLEYATGIVYNESCKECHINLLPGGISDDGITAHLHYQEHEKDLNLQCISCHLDAGHFNPNYSHSKMVGVPQGMYSDQGPEYTQPVTLTAFEDFVETIPSTHITMSMKAIPGGSFKMGSPENEWGRNDDEGPQRLVSVSPFFMGEFEVSWDQYWAFYRETMSEGRTAPEIVYLHNSAPGIDAVSGPTPPFGNPDQGWGMGQRPAVTMTHYAAEIFCKWLSIKTGKTFRLPTEAEWEYAARGGSEDAYFFGGNPRKYSSEGFLRSIFPADTTGINSYVVYKLNSRNKTAVPSSVRANPYGLKNMYGNVMEYCSDWYAADAYALLSDGVLDPKGPEYGEEHVVRGGTYADDATLLRSAARSHTQHDAWLRTDPQNPKSIWWYSDVKSIGFRVVCEVPNNIK